MPPTPFPAGKTIKELGISTDRRFVIANPTSQHLEQGMEIGDTGFIGWCSQHASIVPFRLDKKTGSTTEVFLSELAYYEPTDPEAWKPKVGDVVSIQGVVLDVSNGSPKKVNVKLEGGEDVLHSYDSLNFTFLSRPTPPRKVTRKEIEQALGGEFEMVEESNLGYTMEC